MKVRGGYRDIEGEEMEDYDAIDDDQASEKSAVMDGPEIPDGIAGQINYSRGMTGESVQWMK